MIRVYGFGPAFDLPDASPFVLKVEAFLRWQDIDYQKVNGMGAVRRAGNGKLPLLEHARTLVPDSHAIIQHLVRSKGLVIDPDLDGVQQRETTWMAHTLEEHLYFILLWVRWWPQGTWPQVREALFQQVPRGLRGPVSAMVRRQIRRQAWAQGVARYPVPEIENMLHGVLSSLSQGLGSQTTWFGEDRVHYIDCLLYAFLAPVLMSSFRSKHLPEAGAYPNLRAYVDRMHWRLGFATGV